MLSAGAECRKTMRHLMDTDSGCMVTSRANSVCGTFPENCVASQCLLLGVTPSAAKPYGWALNGLGG